MTDHEHDHVSIKEYFESKIAALERETKARFAQVAESANKVETLTLERFQAHNNFIAEATRKEGHYVTKDILESKLDGVRQKTESYKQSTDKEVADLKVQINSLDKKYGKAQLAAALAVIGALVNIIIAMMK